MQYDAIYPVFYFIGFAALHSFLASLTAKRAARRRFGPKLRPF